MTKNSIYFLFIFISTSLFAQQKEFGIEVAASGYLGDLNTRNPLLFTDLGGNIFYRHNKSEFFSHKFSLGYYGIQGADSLSSVAFQKERNLSFKTEIYDLSWNYEFNFLPFIHKSENETFTPYVFVGLGLMYFNPMAQYQGNNYNLRDLGTEGQGLAGNPSKYSSFMINIPYGLGLKWNVANNFSIGADLNYRFCFGDYLDDVSGVYANKSDIRDKNNDIAAALSDRSGEKNGNGNIDRTGTQRGDTRSFDLFYSFGLNLSYTIIPYKCPDLKKVYKKNYFF